MCEMLRFTLAILFIFFLPGYTLINAVYPARGELDEDLDLLYRAGFSMGSSAAIFVVVGFILGNIPAGGGLFIEKNLWLSLIILTSLFFAVGWYRGGYQRLALISPKLCRPERKISNKKDRSLEKMKNLQELAHERGRLKEKVKNAGGNEEERLKEKLDVVEEKLKRAERDREDDF
ncbi:MAG: DUF1616 domain-containing protein [Thermoplasmata archaeon]